MKKTFTDLTGKPFDVDFTSHDISNYDVLYHMTLKENRKGIEENGLLRFQPQYKSLVETDLLFFSYPVDNNTGDVFRFSEEFHCIVILDAKKLKESGYEFYDDYFTSKDASSKRNHLAIDKDIPKEFILKVVEF